MGYALPFKALYIILLALFHDLQIVTIAYDKQVASPFPETPTVIGLLMQSYSMGILMFVQTMGLIMYGHLFMSEKFHDAYQATMHAESGAEMDVYMQTAVFLQISNSSAILILSARTVGFFFQTMPAWQLLGSTILGQLIVNVWIYDLVWLLILDLVKMMAEKIWDHFKPYDLEHNPALVAKQQKKRDSLRRNNSLMLGNMAEHKRNSVRKS